MAQLTKLSGVAGGMGPVPLKMRGQLMYVSNLMRNLFWMSHY